MTQTTPPIAAEQPSRAGKPLNDEELDQARRWRAAGWSVAIIAQRMRRSCTTIRAYLGGLRIPGPRRKPAPRADAFPAFANYTRQRLADDPHLETRPLHRELAKLGYRGSYQAPWRQLQANNIDTSRCPHCRPPQKQISAAAATVPEHRTALPVSAVLVSGELLSSYLQRLAITNHITVADLLAVLPPWFRTKVRNHDDRARHHMLAPVVKDALNALAALTNTPTARLVAALPAFGSDDLPDPVRAATACGKCLATKGIHQQIPIHMPAYQHICARHRLWISPAGIPQLDLTACTTIVDAQRRARYLAHRFAAEHLIFAQLAAEQEVRNMPYRHTPDPPQRHWRHRLQRLRNTNPQADIAIAHDQFIRAALYPDAIARAAKALDQTSKTY